MPRSASTSSVSSPGPTPGPATPADGSTAPSKGNRGLRRPRQKALFGQGGAPGWDPTDTSGGSYGSRGFGASGHGSRGDIDGAVQGGFSPDAPKPPEPRR